MKRIPLRWVHVVVVVLPLGIAIALSCWGYKRGPDAFLPNLIAEIVGVLLSLAIAAGAYEWYQHWRTSHVIAPLKRRVLRALATRVAHVIWDYHWQLVTGHGTNYGVRSSACDRDPTPAVLGELQKQLADIRQTLFLFRGEYRNTITTRGEVELRGENLVSIVQGVMSPEVRSALRQIVLPLASHADEAVTVLTGVEDLLDTSWNTLQYGIAGRAGEMFEEVFMRELPSHFKRLDSLYSLIVDEWKRLPETATAA